MAVSQGIAGGFKTISTKIRMVVYKKMWNVMVDMAQNLIRNYDKYQSDADSHDVTGNARMSVAIGLYYMRKLDTIVTPRGVYPLPTRRTLKAGQAYNLPEYYGGTPVDPEHPYVGKRGDGGQWGPTLGPRSVKKSASSRATWQMYIVMPVEYAAFPETNHLMRVMQNMYDDMPNELDYSIAYVRGRNGTALPSQGDIPF